MEEKKKQMKKKRMDGERDARWWGEGSIKQKEKKKGRRKKRGERGIAGWGGGRGGRGATFPSRKNSK